MFMPSLTDELVADLGLLSSLPSEDEAKEFCKMSSQLVLLNHLQRSKHGTFISRKILEKAAAKLGIEDPARIDRCIGAIGHLFCEAAKFGLTPVQFSKLLDSAGIRFADVVASGFAESEPEIRKLVDRKEASFVRLPHYSGLDWRLDCVLSSRSKLDQVTPILTLNLETKTPDGRSEKHLLQTDPANLVHMTQVLEAALAELKDPKVKKIQKFL